jgi:hypothetical protein
MMDRNPIGKFDPREFGKFVNKACREKDFGSGAGRAVRTDKFELFAGRGDFAVTRVLRKETDL